MRSQKLSWMVLLCAGIALAPSAAGAEPIFNVVDYGANPAPNTADDTAVHNALCDAVAANGTLFFPAGQWDLTNPLDIAAPSPTCTATPGRITVQGVGRASLIEYSGNADAAIQYAPMGANAQFSVLRDFFLRGTYKEFGVESPLTGLLGQSGIALVGPKNVTISGVALERFTKGYGIYMKTPINSTITDNQVGGALIAIGLRTPCGTEVSKNCASAWANAAIFLFSVPGDGLASRNNSVRENVLHGTSLMDQGTPQSRAAIKVDSVSSTEISNNYIEKVLAPPGFAGHAIWLTRTTTNLNQANQIRGNYLGPGTEGDGIRLSDGLVSHTVIESNQIGGYVIRDDGQLTVFELQYLADISQLTGTSTNRRGWVGLPTGAVQLH